MFTYTYEPIEGFFDLSNSTWADNIKGPFGLKSPYNWKSFDQAIKIEFPLNEQCGPEESIKVIYAARHGEAEHNISRDKYGIHDKNIPIQVVYPIHDPSLTSLGRKQAISLGSALEREHEKGMPLPQKWFVSPLVRTGQTLGLEWGWTTIKDESKEGGEGSGVPAIVIENVRERLHVNLCDSRKSLSDLKSQFPSYIFPTDLSGDDDLWLDGPTRGRENEDELFERMNLAWKEILGIIDFRESTYISLTSHSVALRALYRVLGINPHELTTGEMDILVVKVKKVSL